MKERPILFSGPMVRAILAGEKTQTRRVLQPQPPTDPTGRWSFVACSTDKRSEGTFSFAGVSATGHRYTDRGREVEHLRLRCPYGSPGDRLWVRETWCDLRGGGFDADVAYRAASLNAAGDEDGDSRRAREDYGYKWSPSIHMPRWASRITLEVTGVRVERLQEISEDDVEAEGVGLTEWNGHPEWPRTAGFAELWDSLAKPDAAWADNPWVWVVEFRVAEIKR